MTTSTRPRQIWKVDTSFCVRIPEQFESSNVAHLKRQLQKFADGYDIDPPFGKLTFNVEENNRPQPIIVRVYFTDRFGNKRRFMRLRRDFIAPQAIAA